MGRTRQPQRAVKNRHNAPFPVVPQVAEIRGVCRASRSGCATGGPRASAPDRRAGNRSGVDWEIQIFEAARNRGCNRHRDARSPGSEGRRTRQCRQREQSDAAFAGRRGAGHDDLENRRRRIDGPAGASRRGARLGEAARGCAAGADQIRFRRGRAEKCRGRLPDSGDAERERRGGGGAQIATGPPRSAKLPGGGLQAGAADRRRRNQARHRIPGTRDRAAGNSARNC